MECGTKDSFFILSLIFDEDYSPFILDSLPNAHYLMNGFIQNLFHTID